MNIFNYLTYFSWKRSILDFTTSCIRHIDFIFLDSISCIHLMTPHSELPCFAFLPLQETVSFYIQINPVWFQ